MSDYATRRIGGKPPPSADRAASARSRASDRLAHVLHAPMTRFVVRRSGYALLSLFLLSLTIFFFVRVTGDPAALLAEPGASPGDIAAIHHRFGLDRPLWVQYGMFMASLFHGDLGQSFYYQMPVMTLYLSR
ncbi:MAG TPA: hypothetical protein VE993_12740, partial [Stellaceae bacterium]|nr:hypothetical protein [Stellaceae bacterium]